MDACSARTGNIAQLRYFECLFGRGISVILAIAGIAFFIVLVLGGFKYLTSGGDPKAIDSAKKTLTYGIGGMIVLALAFLFLRFIEVFTGAVVTNFVITR